MERDESTMYKKNGGGGEIFWLQQIKYVILTGKDIFKGLVVKKGYFS